MRRPKLKKASKRMSCSKRYKIQKKVREHHKKLRKEAKKKGVKKPVKKDLGVPNSAPFKEEVLREAEQRRLQIEEENERKRQAKKAERAQKRKKEKEAAATTESEPDAKKTRVDKTSNRSEKQVTQNKNSKHFLCSQIKKTIDAADVVIEVLDARDPLGCRCPQLEEAVLLSGNKKLLLVLNKIDLVPKENVEAWMECLQKELPVVAFKASTQIRHKTVQAKKSRFKPSNDVLDKSRGAACFGNSCLIEILTSLAAARQSEAALKVGVVGFPNVGKSSLINSMKGMQACNVGTVRGTTKHMQDVHILRNLKVMDSPGIVASLSNPAVSMTLRSLQVEDGHLSKLDAVRTLLKECNSSQIMLQYSVPDFKNSLEFLTQLAKKRGFLQKGGVPNTEQAASTFLDDWTGAKLSYHCKVPGNHSPPTYVSDTVVAKMFSGWDLGRIKAGNEETLKGVKFPNLASSISFHSTGPTAGLLSVAEVSEDQPIAAEQNKDVELEQPHQDSPEAQPLEKPQKTSHKEKQVKFQPVPVDISLSTVSTDDAYDFNTDFK
uniref:Guanine nucleotide-binding protein-like 3 n=1 Tax=Nothobranchius pienaari TaxID=704102 RepID=A0A1A8LM30_9TELE